MKLCRFELKSQPGVVRSGMVYSGKVYETNGAQAVGVHEAEAVRPLAPVGHANSIRLFNQDLFADPDEPSFIYCNPASLVGPSQLVSYPHFTGELVFEPYVAAIVVANGFDLDIAQGDDIILGLTILNVLVAKDIERRQGHPGGRSHDIAASIGPVVTTPDELDEAILDSENGRRYALGITTKVNGVEESTANLEELPISFAQAVSFASQSCPLQTGDVIALGPIADGTALQAGDEVHVSIERLGMLATKITEQGV